ncbi:MAG: exonuclease SbcCD subunit D [Acidimicrobiia bacterium]
MPVTIVHAADLHIDSPLRGLSAYPGAPAEEIRGATRRAFENVVELSERLHADLVVIAGDVFDGTWTDFNTGLFFVQQLQRLHDSGIRTVIVHGNHDAESLITNRLRLPASARALEAEAPETVVFEDIGVAVHGQSYAQRAVRSDLAAAYPAPIAGLFNVGLLHTALDGRADHDNYAPCSLATLRRRGYDYWALGHVHTREVVATEPWVVFPGNVQGRHARETGAKGVTVVTVSDSGEATVEEVVLDSVRWAALRVDVTACRNVDDVLERVLPEVESAEAAAGGRLLAARVVLEGRSEAAGALIAAEDHLAAEIRALSMRFARVWVEQVRVEARRPSWGPDVAGPEVAGVAAALRDDTEGLRALFADLAAKVPPELREACDPPLFSQAWLAERAAEAEELLGARLSEAMR